MVDWLCPAIQSENLHVKLKKLVTPKKDEKRAPKLNKSEMFRFNIAVEMQNTAPALCSTAPEALPGQPNIAAEPSMYSLMQGMGRQGR